MISDIPPLNAQHIPLPYENRLDSRDHGQIDLVILHCTETPDLAVARELGETVLYPESGTGNSGHFYIDRDGRILRYVDPAKIAHHTRGFNPRSIGIELVNTGRFPRWLDADHQAMDEPYTVAQIESLLTLLAHLEKTYPSLKFIAGHEDLDQTRVPATDNPELEVWRKRDPGVLFPWKRVMRQSHLIRIAR